MFFLKTSSMKKRAVVLLSIASLFGAPMTSMANSDQVSPPGEGYPASSSRDQIRNFNSSELGWEMKEITDHDIPRDLSNPIREHMEQPLKMEEKLLEELHGRGMKVSTRDVRLMKFVPTIDTPKEIKDTLNSRPLAAYFIEHAIVDRNGGQIVGALVSTADGSLPPVVALAADKGPGRFKRGTWVECSIQALTGIPGDIVRYGGGAYFSHEGLKRVGKKVAAKAVAKLIPGVGTVVFLADGLDCLLDH